MGRGPGARGGPRHLGWGWGALRGGGNGFWVVGHPGRISIFNFSMHASSPGCQALPFPAICAGHLRGAPLLSGLLITAYGHWEDAGLCAPGTWVHVRTHIRTHTGPLGLPAVQVSSGSSPCCPAVEGHWVLTGVWHSDTHTCSSTRHRLCISSPAHWGSCESAGSDSAGPRWTKSLHFRQDPRWCG